MEDLLLVACEEGEIETIKHLVEKIGVDIEIRDNFKCTPLIIASRGGNYEIVNFLLEKGANVEVKNYFGFTPLMFASDRGNFETVKLLLDKGANMEK